MRRRWELKSRMDSDNRRQGRQQALRSWSAGSELVGSVVCCLDIAYVSGAGMDCCLPLVREKWMEELLWNVGKQRQAGLLGISAVLLLCLTADVQLLFLLCFLNLTQIPFGYSNSISVERGGFRETISAEPSQRQHKSVLLAAWLSRTLFDDASISGLTEARTVGHKSLDIS